MRHDLAVFGAEPAFAHPLHVGRPNLGDRARFHKLMDHVFDERWLTNQGPLVQDLEARIERMIGVRNCIVVCNATLGLQVLARSLGLTGEVIVPAFTFVATAHALRWLGLTPIFCDVDPITHTLDPARLVELITPKTSAVVGVHLWGHPCAVKDLVSIADSHGLQLFFDAAHAFGSEDGTGHLIGSSGKAEVFSFHATKFVNSFEGGAITTDDDDLADRLRLARNFGFAGLDQVVSLGTNAKMSEASAAMALTSLESIEDFILVNRCNHQAYEAGLDALDGITLRVPPSGSNCQYVVVQVNATACGLSRDELLAVLEAENVLARRYFYPGCHRMEPYRSEQPSAVGRLPVTETLAQQVLVLPTGTAVTRDQVAHVSQLITTAVQRAPEVRSLSLESRHPWT